MSHPVAPPDAARASAPAGASEEADSLARFLARAFGAGTIALIYYGSRAQGRPTRPESAYDFFVIVERYGPAYRSLAATVGTPFTPWVAAVLARVLAPNIVAVTQRDGPIARQAKCAVLSRRHFRRACGPHPPDHFVQGRLMQHVLVPWSRDEAAAALVADSIARVRHQTLVWGRPTLPPRFDAVEYCEALLATSLAGEIRTETRDHSRTLLAVQRERLAGLYMPVLEQFVSEGALVRDDGRYVLRRRPGRLDRMRVALYFGRSKARAAGRLLKAVALYDGWLDYIVHKIARTSGRTIVITERERRWPLIFLWPKVIHYLRTRPQRETHDGH